MPREHNELIRFQGFPDQMRDALHKTSGVSKKTAAKILEAYPNGQGLSHASIDALMHLGATFKQAERLHNAFALARFCGAECQKLLGSPIRDPADAIALFRSMQGARDREFFSVLYLNARQRPIATSIVAIGSLSKVDLHPRELFREGVRLGAHSVILAHNHPSGSAEPSDADIRLTKRMAEVGRLMGIPVLDHLVVSEDDGVSLAALGLVPDVRS